MDTYIAGTCSETETDCKLPLDGILFFFNIRIDKGDFALSPLLFFSRSYSYPSPSPSLDTFTSTRVQKDA